MNKEQIVTSITNIGETIVVLGAALWITRFELIDFAFATGTALFAIGRFLEQQPDSLSLTLRRLYTQRLLGVVLLMVSALLMLFYQDIDGFEISDYTVRATPSAWLMPFMIFVVIELYTAFRIPAELKKENK